MANINNQSTETTITRQKIMASREADAQRMRVVWAIAAEAEKRRHKEALERAQQTDINGEKRKK